MQGALGGQGGQTGEQGGMGGGEGCRQGSGGFGGRGGGRGGGSEKMHAMRETMSQAMHASQTLEISLSDTSLHVVNGLEDVHIY